MTDDEVEQELLRRYGPATVRLMKLRKRHVREALKRVEVERQQREAQQLAVQRMKEDTRPCPVCGASAKPKLAENSNQYMGHVCTNDHIFVVSRSVWDPTYKRQPTERADVRGLPSGGHAPAPMSQAEVQATMSRAKQLQQQIERGISAVKTEKGE